MVITSRCDHRIVSAKLTFDQLRNVDSKLITGQLPFALSFYGYYREGTFLLGGGGVGRGILVFFCEKSRGPSTSWNGLMHDPSEIPKQKHLTLPPKVKKFTCYFLIPFSSA